MGRLQDEGNFCGDGVALYLDGGSGYMICICQNTQNGETPDHACTEERPHEDTVRRRRLQARQRGLGGNKPAGLLISDL